MFQGPPGTGKTLVLSLAVLYLALKYDKRVLVVTSRNHSAWDITLKIDELGREARTRRAFPNKQQIYKRLVIHHYSDARPGETVPLRQELKSKGPGLHLVSFLMFNH